MIWAARERRKGRSGESSEATDGIAIALWSGQCIEGIEESVCPLVFLSVVELLFETYKCFSTKGLLLQRRARAAFEASVMKRMKGSLYTPVTIYTTTSSFNQQIPRGRQRLLPQDRYESVAPVLWIVRVVI
eukprot:Filipodium_phascolosomae@DN2441_c0_g1_i1.p1